MKNPLAVLAAVTGMTLAETADVVRPRRRRPAAPMRSRLEQRYRDQANARRAFALASKRRNWRRK